MRTQRTVHATINIDLCDFCGVPCSCSPRVPACPGCGRKGCHPCGRERGQYHFLEEDALPDAQAILWFCVDCSTARRASGDPLILALDRCRTVEQERDSALEVLDAQLAAARGATWDAWAQFRADEKVKAKP